MSTFNIGRETYNLGRMKWLISNAGRPFSITITPEPSFDPEGEYVIFEIISDSLKASIIDEIESRIASKKIEIFEAATELAERMKK